MRPQDHYIDEVLRHAFATQADKERLAADLRAHFAQAEERGEPLRQTLDDLGTPEEVAAALSAERPVVYAGFWRRVIAFVGDSGAMVLLGLPALAGMVFFATRFGSGGAASAGSLAAMCALALTALGIFAFYFPLLEARFGRTLGKHLVRIRVIRESGAPISLGQAFVRRLSMYFEFLVLDALFVPFTQKKQRALDIVAQTIVAREPGEDPGWGGYALCLLIAIVAATGVAAMLILCARVG